eukprot:CAMPEP_0184345436 /NCGR_PEP_ID=MMETSP1089-20130417/13849_1 /TAXON_ID=38269 ORGANISM="Gloeochaete wittrockiana, Strain SAG46.84" /NCGR_SAMPLE_ID=MMETSP1089 /ASSEMBLY_ACC=CAM_ASM_000445 /LENGTH=31 /DNA_ID= /DNA_START= /DNA_END= /DNA_ORIENTATION=
MTAVPPTTTHAQFMLATSTGYSSGKKNKVDM